MNATDTYPVERASVLIHLHRGDQEWLYDFPRVEFPERFKRPLDDDLPEHKLTVNVADAERRDFLSDRIQPPIPQDLNLVCNGRLIPEDPSTGVLYTVQNVTTLRDLLRELEAENASLRAQLANQRSARLIVGRV